MVTNCHVTRGAQRIDVIQGGRTWRATVDAHHAVRDICLLRVPGLTAPVPIRAERVSVGQTVFAAGFPADKEFTISEGRIIALHEYDGGHVIQVSAPFDYGSSGGALLDERGRLLGILTFKALAGGAFHFAVPVRWVDDLAMDPKDRLDGQPFWQAMPDRLPYFLRAASRQAVRDWPGLRSVAMAWIANSPRDPGAWRAMRIATGEGTAASGARPASAPALSMHIGSSNSLVATSHDYSGQ